jgi:molybdopterin synthase catalytic subunit
MKPDNEESSLDIEVKQSMRVSDIRRLLAEKYPGIETRLGHALTAINQEYTTQDEFIHAGDEIAFFPPVSGGSAPTICMISQDEPNLNELLQKITSLDTGAAVIFTGFVRGRTIGGDFPSTRALFYEAYQPMAEKMMHQIASEMREKWTDLFGVALIQRVGQLDPMDITVIVACTAGHRDSGAFEAARYGIDRLKEIVPIWKKEIGDNGEEWIEGHSHPGGKGQ